MSACVEPRIDPGASVATMRVLSCQLRSHPPLLEANGARPHPCRRRPSRSRGDDQKDARPPWTPMRRLRVDGSAGRACGSNGIGRSRSLTCSWRPLPSPRRKPARPSVGPIRVRSNRSLPSRRKSQLAVFGQLSKGSSVGAPLLLVAQRLNSSGASIPLSGPRSLKPAPHRSVSPSTTRRVSAVAGEGEQQGR